MPPLKIQAPQRAANLEKKETFCAKRCFLKIFYMTDHDSKAPRYAEGPTNADILQAVQKVSERVGKIETALYGTGNPHGGLCGEFEALTTKVDGMENSSSKANPKSSFAQ